MRIADLVNRRRTQIVFGTGPAKGGTHGLHGLLTAENTEHAERRDLTADERRLKTIRIPWKPYEELLAYENKQASSYPPTAPVCTQILGYLRFAECFQEIP